MTRHPGTPRGDPSLTLKLRRRLEELCLGDEGIRNTCNLQMSADPWSLVSGQPPTDDSPFSTIVTLFWLGIPVERRQAEAALAPLRLTELETLGVLEVRNGLACPLFLIRPAEGLLVASDIPAVGGDPVLGMVPASETLARLTVRRPAKRALDLGTGCGVQGLLLSRHSETVISVDVNPRALAFARFNATLNEATNVEAREGSWFEPVDDERFDTIACNPPYVISPDTTYTYRDGGRPRDAVCRMVVGEVAKHLAEGGFATVLCNWVHDGSWVDPLRPWVADTGCDALLLHYATVDARAYAARWNTELRTHAPEAFEATVRRWVDYYAAEGITHIGLGAVILRQREGGSNWVRALEMANGPTCPSSDHVLRLFDAADFLESPRGRRLFEHAYRLVDGHRVDQTLNFQAGKYAVQPAAFRCEPGIGVEARVDAHALEVLLECNGHRTLEDLIVEAAGRRGEPVAVVSELLDEPVRRLVERGFLVPTSIDEEGASAC